MFLKNSAKKQNFWFYSRKFVLNINLGKDGKRQFNGLFDVYKKTLATDGISGLYRGFTISCVGIFIYRGLYFGLYDTAKPLFLGDQSSFLLSFLLGWGKFLIKKISMNILLYDLNSNALFSRDRCLWTRLLPHRHRPKTNDDDFRNWSPLQVLPRLRHAGHPKRRLHVSHEGRRCQRSPRCCRSWCPLWIRLGQGCLRRHANRINGRREKILSIKKTSLFLYISRTLSYKINRFYLVHFPLVILSVRVGRNQGAVDWILLCVFGKLSFIQ